LSNQLTSVVNSNELNGDLDKKIFNNMFMAKVKFRGSVDLTIIPKTIFCFSIAGFGFCPFIRLKLSDNSHMEINRLFHPSEKIILDGDNIVIIFGFIGYHRELIDWFDITIKGVGLNVIWR
jgi:hypothetical protein